MMPHFFAADILGLLIALSLGIPIVLFPGYLFGWSLNLLSFRARPVNTRWGFAVVLGLGLLPIILYLAGRVGSLRIALAVLSILSVSGFFIALLNRAWPNRKELSLCTIVAVAVWVTVASLSLLDLAVDSRLYPSTAIVDHSYRAQVIASIAFSDHLPPTSFFFFPGHPVAFHYHYFLFLIGAVMVKLGGGLVSARIALVALTVWTGFALIALTAAYIRVFSSVENKQKAIKTGWFLLAIGGLDIVPFGIMVVARLLANKPDVLLFPDVEWWNSFAEVFGWYDSVVWQPHHIAGLVSCLVGGLILWEARNANRVKRSLAILGAALAFASATGGSVLVTAVFFVFFVILAVELLLNSPKHLIALALSGAIAGLLLLPFILEFRGGSGPSAPPYSFSVRPFAPITLAFSNWHIQSPALWNTAFLLALPLNYFFELGVFFVLGIWWLFDARQRQGEDKTRDHLMIGLLLVSLALSSFVYIGSSHSNDFGYRAVLPAQFILLLLSTEIIERYRSRQRQLRRAARFTAGLAYVTVWIGLLTNIANMAVMRSRIAFAESSGTESEIWPQVKRPAELMYQLREAYLWIRDKSSTAAIVQQNPEPYLWLEKKQYSERLAAIQGAEQDGRSDGTSAEFKTTLNRAETLFATGADVPTMQQTCAAMKVDYVVAQDSDPVWQNPGSYVWNEKPVFQMPMVRVFHCSRPNAFEPPSSPLTSGSRE